MNTRLSPDERADLVVKQMTLDEKIQLVHGSMAMLGPKIPQALGGDGFVPGIPRLGIPDLNLIGAGVGVTNLWKRTNGQATALPASLAETATWDPKLAYEFGAVIGRETRDQGFNVSLGGGDDIMREPRNGRNFEYHGEDPVLAGRLSKTRASSPISSITHSIVRKRIAWASARISTSVPCASLTCWHSKLASRIPALAR
jgi:beta-glucosidase